MGIGFEKVIDFAMKIDKLNLDNFVGEVLDKTVEFQIFYLHLLPSWIFYLQKIIPKVKQRGFLLWKMMDFAMDIDKLHLDNLVAKVMDDIMEYQNFCQRVQKDR